MDSLVKVQRTLNANLIKVDENHVALRQVPHPPAHIPEMFTAVPPSEPPSSSTVAAPTTEGPYQTKADKERVPLLLLLHQRLWPLSQHPLA